MLYVQYVRLPAVMAWGHCLSRHAWLAGSLDAPQTMACRVRLLASPRTPQPILPAPTSVRLFNRFKMALFSSGGENHKRAGCQPGKSASHASDTWTIKPAGRRRSGPFASPVTSTVALQLHCEAMDMMQKQSISQAVITWPALDAGSHQPQIEG